MTEQRLQDIATLAKSSLLSALPIDEIGALLAELEPLELAAGTPAQPSTEPEPALHFVLEGELELERGEERSRLVAGDVFGEVALVGLVPRERVMARSDVRLARLTVSAYSALGVASPRTAFHLAQGALRRVASALDRGPRSSAADSTLMPGSAVHGNEGTRGVRLAERLPSDVDGALVVAGRQGESLLSLHALSDDPAPVAPVTTAHWEGRDIYRLSAGLVLLEAARQLGVRLQLGPSLTSGRVVFADGAAPASGLARALDEKLGSLSRAGVAIQEELWPVPDALELFRKQDDPSACLLLQNLIEPVVTLLRCGETWAWAPRPLLPHAGLLEDVHVFEHPLGLLLDFGQRIRTSLARRATPTLALELRAPRYGSPMTRSQTEWLKALGVDSVGTFNGVCVQGRVAELIRVSEGFHEKRIADIADQIKQRGGVRIVAVAGPSSSGKTTFIKRLLVQLRVNGIEPLELSLDDYYLDREHQVRGADGEYDFEALEALDLALLRGDLGGLLGGGTVRPPRYDFQHGQRRPQAGPELRLGERHVLLVEGIHALNPALYAGVSRDSAFNVFIHPATSLPFDRLLSLEPADVRLLRRIVRDRHQRGFAAIETLLRWPSVRRAERLHIFPFQAEADAVFDSALPYEVSVLRVYAERYLLEVPRSSPEAPSARRLRRLLQLFVPIHPDHVPPTSILREFIGGSGFTY